MELADTLPEVLYLGQLARDGMNYGKGKGEPDSSWTTFENQKKFFLKKHGDLKDELNQFMSTEKSKWRNLFNETFKLHSLAFFVKIKQVL